MLRRVGSRTCASVLGRLQSKGSLLDTVYRHVPKHGSYAPRSGTHHTSAAFSSQALHPPPPRSIAQLYLEMLARRPVLTKTVTVSTIFLFAGISMQAILKYHSDKYPKSWNVPSTLAVLTAANGFILGPTLHVWYNFASKVFPGCSLKSTLKKMLMGELACGLTFMVFFFSLNAYFGGLIGDALMKVENNHPLPISIRTILPLASSFIVYKYVPVPLQPLVCSAFLGVWGNFCGYMFCSKETLLCLVDK